MPTPSSAPGERHLDGQDHQDLRVPVVHSTVSVRGLGLVRCAVARQFTVWKSGAKGTMMRRIATATVAVLAASLVGTAAVPAVAEATPAGIQETVVQGGLNAPRHLVLTRAGLVVTEAGTGGPAGASNCATGPATEGAGTSQYCTGPTGDIFTISSRGRIQPGTEQASLGDRGSHTRGDRPFRDRLRARAGSRDDR